MENTMVDSKVNLSLELNPSKVPTVEALRKNGYKVKILHSRHKYKPWTKLVRPPKDYNPISDELYPEKSLTAGERSQHGGLTVVGLRTPEGREYSAHAKCNIVDNFNRKLGVRIALSRIISQIVQEQKDKDVPF